jgi:hypothetical protein
LVSASTEIPEQAADTGRPIESGDSADSVAAVQDLAESRRRVSIGGGALPRRRYNEKSIQASRDFSGLRAWLWTALAVLFASLALARAQSTNTPSRLDYQSFKLITDRNIFDPDRSPRSARNPRSDPRRPARVESFSLVGTLSYEKGTFAFFDGSSSEYRKALKCADTIAGYKVCEITANRVKLEANGQQIELPVGAQMRRQDDDDWALSESGGSSASTASTLASNDKAESSSSSTSGSDGEENDVLKRLLQKRQQELNK